MKRLIVACALVAVAFYAAGAWSASGPTPTEKKLLKDVATLKNQVKALQAQDKKQNTAADGAALLAATAYLLTGCTAETTIDALQGTWQVIDQVSAVTAAPKTFFGPQTPPTASVGGQDLCQILSLSRSQVVPPSAATFQALLAGYNASSFTFKALAARLASH